jgi:aminoglycoside/choline kinase family phosphotransferase
VAERFEELRRWLADVIPERGIEPRPASSDASFRRYFRIGTREGSRIVMDAPPDRESVQRYMQVARKLAAAGVHVPEVYAMDVERGFLLLGDLGDETYLDALARGEPAEPLYEDAIATLLRLQARGDPAGLPDYDRALLARELAIFREWFLERHLAVRLDSVAAAEFARVETFLVDAALAQPRALVHRDYHSRNLMLSEPNPGVLDFQDAVVGPIAYDLVSLLRDCYVAWPREWVAERLRGYHARASVAGLPVGTLADFTRGFDLTGVQRHLKATGIFARLWHRDGKAGYLGDIPRVLDYLKDVAHGYRELDPLARLIDCEVLPRLAV